MKPNQRAQWGKTAGIFALGAAAGSVIALLYAPASGRTTRKKIGMKFKSLQRSTAQQVLRAKKVLARKAGTLQRAATEKLEDTREWLVERMSNGKHPHPAPRRVHS